MRRFGKGTSIGIFIGSAALAAALVAPARGGAAPGPLVDDLVLKKVGSQLYWDGVVIRSAQVADDALCGVVHPCYEYVLSVPDSPSGSRLRIGFTAVLPQVGSVRPLADTVKSPEMHFEIQLYAPGTSPSTHEPAFRKQNETSSGPPHGYSAEFEIGGIDQRGAALLPPNPGKWTIRVVPMSVVNMGFRMRATLEDATAYGRGRQLPDLRMVPPFELNFGTVAGSYQPGITTEYPGSHVSCMPEELEEAAQSGFAPPQLCLRFSMGLENAGVGTFELVWRRPGDEAAASAQTAGTSPKLQVQRVCDYLAQDCAYEPARDIYTTFHPFHIHEHWQGAWSVRLFQVMDPLWDLRGPPPAMNDMGPARKLGINPAAELLADWNRFLLRAPAAIGDDTGCLAEEGGYCSGPFPIALAAGWADLYEWNRGGNYVDFPQGLPLTPAPGVYSLQAEIDPMQLVAEADENNNRSYALFEVKSDGGVRLIERGYGASPWDPRKTVLLVSP